MASLRRVRAWERGYVCSQVDGFVARAVDALAGDSAIPSAFSPRAIRRAGFDFGWGGYDVAAVDRFLDGLEQRAVTLRIAGRDPRVVRAELQGEIARLRTLLAGDDGERFARAAPVATGYDVAELDAFAERLLTRLDAPAGAGIDPDDVRFVLFTRRRGGYDEDAVDDVLDIVIDVALRQLVVAEAYAPAGPEPDADREPEHNPDAGARGAHSAGMMAAHEHSIAEQDASTGP